MARIKLSSKFKSPLTKEQWGNLCPENEYKTLDPLEAFELGIVPKGIKDLNSVLVASSGSVDGTIMYFATSFRVDHHAVDQEPYFELFESGSSMCSFYGMLHHADYPGRTVFLNQDQIERIAASGSMVDIVFTSKPSKPTGSLDDLRQEGKIAGLEFTHNTGLRK